MKGKEIHFSRVDSAADPAVLNCFKEEGLDKIFENVIGLLKAL
jgi:hypothetical protein